MHFQLITSATKFSLKRCQTCAMPPYSEYDSSKCATVLFQWVIIKSHTKKLRLVWSASVPPQKSQKISATVLCTMSLFCWGQRVSVKSSKSQLITHDKLSYRVDKKIWHTFCMPYNLIKYWPIFKLFFTVKIRRKFVILLSLKILPHFKCIATLPCKMSMSWSNN